MKQFCWTCFRCSECSELMVMKFPCTTTTDTICVCKEEHYYRSLFRTCTKCSTCKVGYGVVQDCSHSTKRVCQQCVKVFCFPILMKLPCQLLFKPKLVLRQTLFTMKLEMFLLMACLISTENIYVPAGTLCG